MARTAKPSKTVCDGCDEYDDHPKVNVGYLDAREGETFHNDCLPGHIESALADNPVATNIIQAAKDGVHGDDLRKHIQSLHDDDTKGGRK